MQKIQREKEGRDKLGVRDYHIHTDICKIDKQKVPTIQHRKLCSMFCIKPIGGKYLRKNIYAYIYMCVCIYTHIYEFIYMYIHTYIHIYMNHFMPETNTPL